MLSQHILQYRIDFLAFLLLTTCSALLIRFFVRRKTRLGGLWTWVWIVVAGMCAIGGMVAEYVAQKESARLQQSVSGLAPTYAYELERMGHAQITIDTPANDPRYLALIEAQKAWFRRNPNIADLYTFRRLADGKFVVILNTLTSAADSNGRRNGQLQRHTQIGRLYTGVDEFDIRAMEGETSFDPVIVMSKGGPRVSAFHPMYDSAGHVDAVLGVDFPADKWVARIINVRVMVLSTLYIAIILICAAVFITQLRTDITELRRVEDALRVSEKRFRSLVESVPNIAVQGYDRHRRVIFWNPASAKLYGFTEAEALGRQLEDLIIPPPMREPVIAAVQGWVDGGAPIPAGELVLMGKGGLPVNVYSSHVMQVNSRGESEMYCVDIDLTERNQAEAARRLAEERFRLIFENAIEGIFQVSPEGKFVVANAAVAQIFGYSSPGEFLENCRDIVQQDFLSQHVKDELIQLIQNQSSVNNYEFEVTRRDGSKAWVSANLHVVCDAHGRIACYEGSLIDTTERRRSEKALVETQQRLQAILDQSPAIVYVKDLEGRYILTNRLFDQKFHTITDGLIGKTVHDLFPKEVADELLSHDLATLSSSKSYALEEKSQEADGLHTYLAVKFPLRDSAGKIYAICGISTDITEKKTLEAQFLQAQKMDAVGQLAGGMAHDFNNILAGFMLNVGLLLSEPDLSAEVRESLKDIQNQAKRAASLTRRLLLFSRRQIMETKKLELRELLEDIAKMLRRVLGERYSLTIDQGREPVWVEADAGMLDQLVMNLCVNARDAMPSGGPIAIRLHEVNLDEVSVARHPKGRPGSFACLEIVDTGCGMPESTLKRLFEPFFTTKEVGKGTGLGLATVYGVAQQHHGWVEVQSAEGKGSSFSVYLPACKRPESRTSNHPFPPSLRGSECVLLVEDEYSVRKATRQVLEHSGYRVLEAETGHAALRLWDENKGEVVLLFTDMVLSGGMSGLELARLLRIYKPSLKIIICSGYTAELVAERGDKALGAVFLSKPFSTETLIVTVRDCLDDSSARKS